MKRNAACDPRRAEAQSDLRWHTRASPAGSTARLRRDASDARDRVAERLRRSYGYYALSGISVTAIRDTYIPLRGPGPHHGRNPASPATTRSRSAIGPEHWPGPAADSDGYMQLYTPPTPPRPTPGGGFSETDPAKVLTMHTHIIEPHTHHKELVHRTASKSPRLMATK